MLFRVERAPTLPQAFAALQGSIGGALPRWPAMAEERGTALE